MKKQAANFVTCIRIICSAALLFVHVPSPAFYIIYLIAGASDMLDGAIARRTNAVSPLGSRLDTAADFGLFAVCAVRLTPVLQPSARICGWAAAIALIKAVNVVYGLAVHKRFIAVHSVMNKVTGCLLFLLPLTVGSVDFRYSSAVVCAAATIAAIDESRRIKSMR